MIRTNPVLAGWLLGFFSAGALAILLACGRFFIEGMIDKALDRHRDQGHKK